MADSERPPIIPPRREDVEDEPYGTIPTAPALPPPPAAPRTSSISRFPPGRSTIGSIIPAARTTLASLLPAARASIESMLPPAWRPRWKPWSPQRVLGATLGFAAAFGVFMYIAYPRFATYAKRLTLLANFGSPAAAAPQPTASSAEPAAQGEADKNLVRQGRSPVAGGLLIVPPSFKSADGTFDLVIHFHGNTDLVEESIGAAKVNAVLVIYNLGIGSGPYEDKFTQQGLMAEIFERVKSTMGKRGLDNPKLRRVALTAWSAGYGAVVRTLEQPVGAQIDAVILMDGIHVGFMADGHTLDPLRIKAYADYARLATDGKKLFSITHSNIVPGTYAGTRATTEAVLKEVGVERTKTSVEHPMPVLSSLEGVVSKSKLRPLKQESEARKGKLIVRGYWGETPEDHMSHLMQMSVVVLPDLVEHWSKAQ
jgi:hypothetical protein